MEKEVKEKMLTDGSKGEVILYQPDETIRLEVRLSEETVWLNREQMAILFARDVKTIGKHIKNALNEELQGFPVVAKIATTARDGKTYRVAYYSLDMVLSVGYRVKSQKGVEFRQWANRVLKEYLLRGYAVNQRFERLERRMSDVEDNIDFFVRSSLPPVEGVFYDGQIFDAFHFVSGLIRSAKQRVILIDNYIDDSVLTILDKREADVSATIITRSISQQLQLDITRHNAQYALITIHQSAMYHDRFLIVDDTVYHIGASLKDLGKKLFAFSRMSIPVAELTSFQ